MKTRVIANKIRAYPYRSYALQTENELSNIKKKVRSSYSLQARSWGEILEGAPSAIRENFLGATPFTHLPHPLKPLKFAYVTLKISSKAKDCDEDSLEKLVVYFCDYGN